MEDWEKQLIGKEVSATMNGVDFRKGILEEVQDFFIPYKVKLESGESRYFVSVKAS